MTNKKLDEAEAQALKKLIRDTISVAGPIDPAAIPHKLRERLERQVSGDIDVDAYIAEVLRETKKTT